MYDNAPFLFWLSDEQKQRTCIGGVGRSSVDYTTIYKRILFKRALLLRMAQ